MKLKRTKLAALAMSALMAVSAFSPYVYAEEVEETTEVVTEAEAIVEETVAEETEAAVVEEETEAAATEAVEEADQPSLTATVDVEKFSIYDVDISSSGYEIVVIVNDGDEDHAIDITTASGTDSKTGYTYTVEYTKATCTDTGKLVMKLVAHGVTLTLTVTPTAITFTPSDTSVTVVTPDQDAATMAALECLHGTATYDDTDNGYYVDENGVKTQLTCAKNGEVYLYYPVRCDYCDEILYWMTSSEATWGAPHTMVATGVIVANVTTGNIKTNSTTVSAAGKDLVDEEGLQVVNGYVPSGTYRQAVLDSDGNPQLSNAQNSGTYYVQYYCSACQQYVYVEGHLLATEAAYAKVVKATGIRYFYFYSGDGKLEKYTVSGMDEVKLSTSLTNGSTAYVNLPDDEDIELIDCNTPGSYTIRYYTADGEELTNMGETTITVKAHHMTIKVAVFDDQDDLDKVTISYDSEGNLSVKSSVCTPTITYYEVEECYAEGCTSTKCSSTYELAGLPGSGVVSTIYVDGVLTSTPASKYTVSTSGAVVNGSVNGSYAKRCTYKEVGTSTKKTADTGSHTWLDSVFRSLEEQYGDAIDAGYKVTSEATSENTSKNNIKQYIINALANVASDYATYGDYVKITSDTSTCTSSGTVTVTFYCTTEGARETVVYTKTYDVDAHGHDYDDAPTAEITKEATCTEEGEYVRSWLCNYCGNEKEPTETKTIERLAHTNEIANDGTSTAASGNYANDVHNRNNASTIYIEVTGDKVVDYGGSLLYATNVTSALAQTTNTHIYGTKNTTSSGHTVDLIGGGTEGDATLGVTVRVYTKCEVCGYEVDLTSDDQASSGLTVTLVDIQKQDTNGANGYITLKFSYGTDNAVVVGEQTKTFNYYTSSTAYNGRVDKDTEYDPDVTTKNGLYLDDDGVYRYYVNDEFASDFAGLVEYDGAYFFVANGLVCTDANGLNLYGGQWYMLANGQVQSQYTGVAIYDGQVFYITNGILDTSVTGLKDYNGGTFLFCYGRLMSEVSGLWFNDSAIGGDDTFYYLAYGQVVDYTGAVIYDNTFFLVENGKLSTYTGTYVYDGATFNVENGQFISQVA
ncbi:MAG: hypothetical protein LUF27_00720 [Lachnospiraceae bacterium]|nr:hypothetical protein [Lachnospiraceae bacterium]